jgi:transcriptional regulator with XRE-family HTH domain
MPPDTPERALIRALKLHSQSELARRAGVSPQHICDVVKGRRRMWPALMAYLGFERVTSVVRSK